MPNWECPKCHTANLPDHRQCRACGTSRPREWQTNAKPSATGVAGTAIWHCSCGKTNPVTSKDCESCGRRRPVDRGKASYCKGRGHTFNTSLTYCEFCGWRPDEDPPIRDGPPPPPAVTELGGATSGVGRELRDALKRQSSGILDQIKTELDASMRDSARSLDDLRALKSSSFGSLGQTPGPSGAGAVGETSRPASGVPPAAGPAFQRVTTRNIEVQIQALPKLNYALLHAGLPLIQRLEITNTSKEPAHDVLVRAWVAPDYGEPWQRSVAQIPARGSHAEQGIVVPLRKARLQEVREAEKGSLRIDVLTEGALQYSETYPLEVLAYSEWYYHPAIPQTVACFVQPNSPAVERIVSLVRDRLKAEGRESDLSGYQTQSVERVRGMVEALYGVLQHDLGLSYINAPPSFEQPETLRDGGYTVSQKIFFPEQILEHRRGTCLDLALLAASCLERIGLHPIFFLIRGHALFGVWLRKEALEEPVLRDFGAVQRLLDGGEWLALNSTTFAASAARPFSVCLDEARACLGEPGKFQCAVDIVSARGAGVKPIPPLVSAA